MAHPAVVPPRDAARALLHRPLFRGARAGCVPPFSRARQPRRMRAYRETDTPIIQGLVTGLTEAIRAVTGGKSMINAEPFSNEEVDVGDLAGMLAALREDWVINKYYITGIIADALYEPGCTFSDPTISFTGVDTWRKNMALVVPFQEDPSIRLFSLEALPKADAGAAQLIQADWRLEAYIVLPWRPLVTLTGRTTYTLNQHMNKVVKHTEAWSISGTAALLQLLRPTSRSQWAFLRPK